MEMINNFAGKQAMLVLRPADAAETSIAYQMAMENRHAPTALILSRQDIKDLPAPEGVTRAEAARAQCVAATPLSSLQVLPT